MRELHAYSPTFKSLLKEAFQPLCNLSLLKPHQLSIFRPKVLRA